MLENQSIIAWIMQNNIKTESGEEYDLKKYLFMYDILRDSSKEICGLKAAQIGFSTAMLLKSMWVAKNRNMDIIYTLPTQTDVKDFAGGKINRIIAQNPILQEWVKEKDTVEQKTVGSSIIYYRGTFTEKAAMMVSSDLNIHDEVDASNQEVLEQYATRLQASDYKWQWWFSHPSLKNLGIDKIWEQSDKKHWFVKCKCGHEQYLSFPKSIKKRTYTDKETGEKTIKHIYVCKKKDCNKEITDEQRRTGRWVQKHKDRKISGYWIPLLIAPWITADEIIEYKEKKTEKYFYNKVLGLPYLASDDKVQRQQIMQNVTSEVNNYDTRTVIGVDTGLGIHLIAGNQQGIFYKHSSKNYDRFEELMRIYPDAIAVFDAQGDLQKPRDLVKKYKGRIWLCWYNEDRKSDELVRWKKDKQEVTVDRNKMIQLVIDEHKAKRLPLFGTEEDWEGLWEHYDNIYAVTEETKLGTGTKRWHRNGADHLVHAEVYWRVGMTRPGGGKATLGAAAGSNGKEKIVESNGDGTYRTYYV